MPLSLLVYSVEGIHSWVTTQSVFGEELTVASTASPYSLPSSTGCMASQKGEEMNFLYTPTGHQVPLDTGSYFITQAYHPSD